MTSYTLYTSKNIVALTPYGAGADQTISINGTTIILLTAASGETKTYTVAVTQDITPPTAGNINVKVSEPGFITLNWTAATDDLSAQSNISYALYKSTGADISTVVNAEANGTLIKQFYPNSLEGVAAKLALDTTYYFAVIAQDEAGNKAVYLVINQKTKGAYQAAAINRSGGASIRAIALSGDGNTIYVGGISIRLVQMLHVVQRLMAVHQILYRFWKQIRLCNAQFPMERGDGISVEFLQKCLE